MKNRIVSYYYSLLNETPIIIRAFLRNALIFFVIWKVVYIGFLLFDRILDRPLTNHIGASTAWFLNHCTPLSGFTSKVVSVKSLLEGQLQVSEASQVQMNGENVLYIADPCNGLELIVLYVGFIVCFPSSLRKKILYIILGILVIDVANILRCGGLVFLKRYYDYDLFQFAHHYGFKITLYGIIFMMWTLFAKNSKSVDDAL